jgi:HSP20 family protein
MCSSTGGPASVRALWNSGFVTMVDFPTSLMWSEACAALVRAERLHGEFFRPARTARRIPVWEPPIDVLETEREVLVLMALPGVDPDRVDVVIEDGELIVAGVRALPAEFRTAVIHRLEIPQGRLERRVRLPAGSYSSVRRTSVHGCLVISLWKAGLPSG